MDQELEFSFSAREDPTLFKDLLLQKNKLGVSVTSLPNFENHIITEFASDDELIEAILASCTMTPLAGFPFRLNKPGSEKLHNMFVVDGGLSNIQPSVFKDDEAKKTVTVSAFSHWECDIKPSQYVPLWWGLYPATLEQMQQLYDLGLYDGFKWLNENNYIEQMPSINHPGPLVDQEEKRGSTLKRTLSFMSALGEDKESLDGMGVEELESKLLDKVIMFSQRYALKSLTVVALYAELCYLSGFSFLRSLVAASEEKRRQYISPSKHIGSIRRWIPSSLLGTSENALNDCHNHAQKMMSLKPTEVWRAANLEEKEEESFCQEEEKILQESRMYSTLKWMFKR
eukprot:maker-scaffold_3-snap-gene-4.37-mRNA-1 protein AED:0.00 eAED:0.00 QI:16/0/0.5/1/0/0/2/107/341